MIRSGKQRPITLKSVHHDDTIYFLVSYLDRSPSETHKSWGWDSAEEIYKQMSDREDVFVFKWSLVGNDVNLGFREAEPHRADIWFWKARRTNPVGYADDKWHGVVQDHSKGTKKVPSSQHGTLYLTRKGDAGRSAYAEKFFYEYKEDTVPKYYGRQPRGSRADVRAKGMWRDGAWTIEFARQLNTGNEDDVVFAGGGAYLFGPVRTTLSPAEK